jgi:hypothetical protein
MPIDCDGALKDPASDGSRDSLGLDVSAVSTAMDLPQKRPIIESAQRAALWSRFACLVLVKQRPDLSPC